MSRFRALPPVVFAIAVLCASAPAAQSGATPPPAGIFVTQADGTHTPIRGTMSQDVEHKGIGKAILSQGFIKPGMVVRHTGATADLVITNPHPTFFFRMMDPMIMQTDPMAYMAAMQGGGGGLPPMSKDPKQFVLARMTVDGDARLIDSKKLELFKLEMEKKATREFNVRPVKPLEPGEYALFEQNGGPASQIWAFSLKAAAR